MSTLGETYSLYRKVQRKEASTEEMRSLLHTLGTSDRAYLGRMLRSMEALDVELEHAVAGLAKTVPGSLPNLIAQTEVDEYTSHLEKMSSWVVPLAQSRPIPSAKQGVPA